MSESTESPARGGEHEARGGPGVAPPTGRPPRRPSGKITIAAVALGALIVGGTGLGLALTAGASTPGPAPSGCGGSQPRLTVQGTGQAGGTPDLLTAVFGFSTIAASSQAALNQNNGEVNQALLALSGNGVAKADVQTTNLTISPQYVYPKGVPTLTGYQVTNTLSAKLRDMQKAGGALDAVVNATGNAATINSLTVSFANPAHVEDEARVQAVHQAVSHAAAMAAASGRRLGSVCSLTDNTQPSVFAPGVGYAASAGSDAAQSTAVPVEPGSQNETDQVTMVYALTQR
jgi:hypothetical protein